MDLSYFVEWVHTYFIHFGAWVSFMIAATVYKTGVPDMPDKLILKAMFLSAFISIFSSSSHNHFLQHFTNSN